VGLTFVGKETAAMPDYHLNLVLLPGTFAVCRLPTGAAVPAWAAAGDLVSITRTRDELSIVCPQDAVPEGVHCTRGFCCLRVAGTLDLGLVGVLAALVVPLAGAGVSVFPLATFDTDYLLLREADLPRATQALQAAGHAIAANGPPTRSPP
jgi:hypothetical protein